MQMREVGRTAMGAMPSRPAGQRTVPSHSVQRLRGCQPRAGDGQGAVLCPRRKFFAHQRELLQTAKVPEHRLWALCINMLLEHNVASCCQKDKTKTGPEEAVNRHLMSPCRLFPQILRWDRGQQALTWVGITKTVGKMFVALCLRTFSLAQHTLGLTASVPSGRQI